MLKSLTAALRLSELREKLNDLNAVTDPTEAQQTEERALVGELKTCEVEYRDALQTEDDAPATVPVDAAETDYRAILQILWDGVTLVPDEITKAKTGEVAITAILLVATKILRADSFYRQQTQHVA